MTLKDRSILFLCRTMGQGGTERVVLQLCRIFVRRAAKVIVCSCGGVNEAELEEMGVRHYRIPDMESKSPGTMLAIARTLRAIVADEGIDVIHTHHRMAAFYVSLLGLHRKCVCIHTGHNTFENRRLLTRVAYRKTNLIACGEAVRRNMENVYGARGVTVIHNAVEEWDGTPARDEELTTLKESGCFLVCNAGRLSEQKGMKYFVAAIPPVLERHPNARFFIIGSGEEEESLRAQSREQGTDGALTFMGYRSDVQSVMSRMDLVVLSSLWEGLPLTPIEAFSVGRTVVATAVDGTPEIVRHEHSGLLVAPGDPEQLAESICRVIENPEERRRMEREALRDYREKFSIERLTQAYVDYYEGI